jgi:broad specificity phosphatase PhoE
MRLLISRHGNTFSPCEPVVCAGARNDLPLVATGKAQAEKLADYLKLSNITPTAIYCSPLQRTRTYADIIVQQLQCFVMPTIDFRLNELDYGDWTGLTTAEITEKFGPADFENWEKNSQWPQQGHWSSSESTVIQEVQSLADDLSKRYGPNDTVLLITSNGRLRYFLTLISGEFERHVQEHTFKVATGNVCEMDYQNNKWSLQFWNRKP